jgi:hypothetical protein
VKEVPKKATKAKKPQLKVRDLKPKKNVKGSGAPKMGWDIGANKKL